MKTSKKFKNLFLLSLFLFCILGVPLAGAFQTDSFKGYYQILSKQEVASLDTPIVLFDVDRLEVIWGKYSRDPLPSDLEKFKNEPTIIIGFSHEPIVFLSFEKGALIGNGYVALQGSGNDRIELKINPNQQNELALRKDGRIFYYRLGPKQNLPDLKVQLESLIKID